MQLVAGAILCGRQLIGCGNRAHRAEQYKGAVSSRNWQVENGHCSGKIALLDIAPSACCTLWVLPDLEHCSLWSDQLMLQQLQASSGFYSGSIS